MLKRTILALALFVVAVPALASPPLAEYVQRKDPAYRISDVATWNTDGVRYIEARVVSQAFQGVVWWHVLTLAQVENAAPSEHAILVVTGGRHDEAPASGRAHPLTPKRELERIRSLAVTARLPIAAIQQVPYQPLFDGKMEDEIISHTLTRYFQTGDVQWPLLLPMVKSAVRAMDATQELASKVWRRPIHSFTVTGESKRGWTSWLTAAVDRRVKALAPMVFDILNMRPQLAHQKASWGRYSEEIGDYSGQGLPEMLATPLGGKLLAVIDPFEYRAALRQPKLIVHATNDAYWPIDAARLYADELPGRTYHLYAPNEGHDIEDRRTVDESRAALALEASGQLQLPNVGTTISDARIVVTTDVVPVRVRLWRAEGATRDLRKAKWRVAATPAAGKIVDVALPRPETGFAAAYVELSFDLSGRAFTVTSPATIVAATDLSRETSP